jgi:uncharacterized membrane protein YoaK (UPF0700 family)
MADDLAASEWNAAAAAVTMVLAFLIGAFVASMAIESQFFGSTANAYGVALWSEALLLVGFAIIANLTTDAHDRLKDAEAAILCAAMGLQNSLVTRLSGAVVRTTHLTGVVTDIGVEAARWFRWWRGTLSETLHLKLAFGRNTPEMPQPQKLSLLLTISFSFTVGAMFGATASVRYHHAAMLFPSAAVALLGLYAFSSGRVARPVKAAQPHLPAEPR